MAEPTKLIIDVTGGIIPGELRDELSRRWSLTTSETHDPAKLGGAISESALYAVSISDPQQVNWVRWEWTWL